MEENNLLNESNINKTDNVINNFNKGIEILSKRGKREKHFLQENGDIIATMYSDDVHFEKNGSYEEIDNSLVKVENYYRNKNNSFKVYFNEINNVNLMGYELLDGNLNISILNSNNVPIQIVESETKFNQVVKYENIFDGIDFEYDVTPTKVKENIIIKNKDSIVNELNFIYNTNLELKLNENGSINAIKNNETLFVLDAPYIKDAKGDICTNTYYQLEKIDTGYKIKLQLDYNWLSSNDVIYPIVIDPTISTYYETNVYDTYIYPGDTNVDRNSLGVLKAGVERVNGKDVINRALVKFDLPKIGTGSQVYGAYLIMHGYPTMDNDDVLKYVNVHRLTTDWNESNANWSTMNDKYDDRIEASSICTRSEVDIDGNITFLTRPLWDVTNLVKRWYSDTPNYGIMLKQNKEQYLGVNFPAFFSKDAKVTGVHPRAELEIHYRNQNGIEEYMDYETQEFSDGMVYENSYNGNLVCNFSIGSTIEGKYPAELELFYNTNDVVLENNMGYGLGYKLNVYQTIKKTQIDKIDYLEFMDEDGTIHYFVKGEDEVYIDEDNLGMSIVNKNDAYILSDKLNNTTKFIKYGDKWYLVEYKDPANNKILINYDDKHRVNKIVDADNQEINILYNENKISIVSPDDTVDLIYNNGQLISLETIDGSINFSYNENHLISRITDKDGTSNAYEYYEQKPYRVKKVIDYGLNNKLGAYFTMKYGNKTTTFIDNKNRSTTINYNEQGNALSSCNFSEKGDIKNAYASMHDYGLYDEYKNKLLSNKIPIKYVNNYLRNTSFANDNIYFVGDDNCDLAISNDNGNSGNRSLKIVNNSNDTSLVEQTLSVPKGKYYTFSAYIKNNNKTNFALSYRNIDNELIETKTDFIEETENFARHDITIFYPEDAISDLNIKIYMENIGVAYIDDVQLEEGEVANLFNYIDNSDFKFGLNDWELSNNKNEVNNYFSVVTLEDGISTALKIHMDPENGTSLRRTLNISGTAGDVFEIGFWYKNNGIAAEYNSATVQFNYIEEHFGHCISLVPLNPSYGEWQYISLRFLAEAAYDTIYINFLQNFDANDLYITNLSFFKGIAQESYDYDKNGNLLGISKLDNNSVNYSYDTNNQLIKMTDCMGKNFRYEYDNQVKDRVLNSISEEGIYNSVKYDENENPIITRTINKGFAGEMKEGIYNIRAKGTNYYVANIRNYIVLKNICEKHCYWKIEKVEDSYRIIYDSVLGVKYLTICDNQLCLLPVASDNSIFNLFKNENGSYCIKTKFQEKYIIRNEDKLELSSFEINNSNFEFYFEVGGNNIFIENNAQYTDDGRFVKQVEDSNFHVTKYDIDPITGLTKTIINPKNHVISYDYNEKKQLKSSSINDRTVNYEYNVHNLLSKIKKSKTQYNFVYDDYLNDKSVVIGDNHLLMVNEYEPNDGNLNQILYSNGQSLKYEYDEYDRITKIIKMDDTYHLKYGNNGDLLKVISNNHLIRYFYDAGKKLEECKIDDFKIRYKYNKNGLVTNTSYILDIENKGIKYTYNDGNVINETIFDNNTLHYDYDSLGRIESIYVNNVKIGHYKYKSYGKRTTSLISEIELYGEHYYYKYDKLDNITHVYHNDQLESRYFYNEYNELIQEDNYAVNKTIKYGYDMDQNILYKKVYDLYTNNLISQNNYKYEDAEWGDLLTSYNDNLVVSDNIGNIISIGDNILLNWINGSQLNNYTNYQNSINATYEYNCEGTRIGKIVNGVDTKYYLEGSDIIFEQTGNNMLYYIRDEIQGLIGFTYNESLYYYLKNLHGDIIGILDDNFNIVAKYLYDGYGKVLSILDGNNNDVSGNNNHIGNINPFRYGGYYYDKESQLYYLNTRYYSPELGRFISADEILGKEEGEVGYNLFAYTSNNPVNMLDENGTWAWFVIKAVVVAVTLYDTYKAVKKAVKKPTKKNITNAALSFTPIKKAKAASKVYKSVTKVATPVKKKVNNNSKSSKATNHLYQIVDTQTQKKNVVKVGISSGKLNANNTSKRANRQVNMWNKDEGTTRYSAEVMKKNIPGRSKALEEERSFANEVWNNGNTLNHHCYPNPDGRSIVPKKTWK